MGLGQMNGFADIVKTKQVKDSEGFTRSEDEVLASIRSLIHISEPTRPY